MLIYHFVDLNLGVEIFFEKERTTETWNVDFEVENSGTSVHLYFGRGCLLFYCFFWWQKRITFKALLT